MTKFLHHVGGNSGDEIECCPTNSEAVARDARVAYCCRFKNLIDTPNELSTGKGNDGTMSITVCSDGVIDVQFVLDKMFMQCMNGV